MATPVPAYFPLTGDTLVDGLTNGHYWQLDASKTIDFSLSNGFLGESWNRPDAVANYLALALATYSYYADVDFNYIGYFTTPEVAASYGSDIDLSVQSSPLLFSSNAVWAMGLSPNSFYDYYFYNGAAGDLFLNVNSAANSLPSYEPGSQGWFLLIHELGHVLGLKHPHDDGGTGRPTFTQLGLENLNIDWATVMSYNDTASLNLISWDPATPMILDVLALQYLYGKNLNTNAGDSIYTLTESGFYLTLWDASGVDTLDASTASSGWTISLPTSSLSTLVDTKVGFALPTSQYLSGTPTTLEWLAGDYENVVGSNFDDVIVGNQFDNIISGGFGNDVLNGEGGNDILNGHGGSDTAIYTGIQSSYVITPRSTGGIQVSGPEGIDTLFSIESLTFADASVQVTSNNISAEFRVNTYITNNQSSPSVTGLSDGGWVVTWVSDGQDGSSGGIYGQRYSSTGVTSGSEFRVNTYTTNNQGSPSVTGLSDGGWVVTWVSDGQDGWGWGIYGQCYSSDGAASGSEFRVNTFTTGDQLEPSVTGLSDGGWVVTWDSNKEGWGLEIYSQRYSSTGISSGSEFRVNTTFMYTQSSPSVTGLSDGGWVVSWLSNSSQNGSEKVVYGQRYNADGAKNGNEFQVNTYTSNLFFSPSVTALSDGGWVVTWQSSGQDGSSYGIYGQRYSSTGVTSGSEFRVNTYTTNSQDRPSVTALSDGGWVVTWESSGQDGSSYGIYGQRYSSTGVTSGSEFRVNTYTTDSQSVPSVTALSDGGWVVTWSSYRQEGFIAYTTINSFDGSGGIYGQRYDAAGVALTSGFDLRIVGDASNQTLIGSIGKDTLVGGLGDDTYVVDNRSDVVTELSNEGTDTVRSSVTYTLSNDVENLTLTDTATIIYGTGNSLDNKLIGNSGNNNLGGGGGNDTLDGGEGVDTLVGGLGDDAYVVDNTGDVITELSNEGTDTVRSSVTHTLSTNVENLTLTGTAAINGTGNNAVNVITGNSGSNILSGLGGDDAIEGRGSNDTINGGEGIDTAFYSGDRNQYQIVYNASTNTYTVTDTITNRDGADTLTNVEYLKFGSAAVQATNLSSAPTGSVTITGTPTQGQILAATNTLGDVDGMGTVAYQWRADGTNISGATSSSFTLTQAQVGKAITVIASYTDLLGTPESVTSSATVAVVNVNDAPTGSITITGTTTQGQTLTATNTLADLDGLGTISYQWQVDGRDISGATSTTYTLLWSQVGGVITVIARYTDLLGAIESVESDTTTAVTNVNDAPTGTVTISGFLIQGSNLVADASIWDLDGLGTFAYQWRADGIDIGGATSTSYKLTQAEVGKAIDVVVSYTDGWGTDESVASSATVKVANINDPHTGSASISGIATQGQILTATNTLADLDGLGTITYQWKAGNGNITGATESSYTLTQAEVGKLITVVASYIDLLGTPERAVSNTTTLVLNANDSPTGGVVITGTPTQGQILSVSNTLADLDGLGAISYQWQAGGIKFVGATGSTYILTQAEVGKTIIVLANYTDRLGSAESVASVATAVVANVNDAPSGSVAISGVLTQGQTLTATNTLADLDGLGTITYQWQADGININGANNSAYTLTQAQVGKTISVVANYTDLQGTPESISSRVTIPVYFPGQSVINLGSYGNLINPVLVDGGIWYYYWDRSGDGTSQNNAGSLNGRVDYVTHTLLDSIFTQDISGVDGGIGTNNTYRYATLNGVRLALPTINGDKDLPANYGITIDLFANGTTVGSNPASNGNPSLNPTYDGLFSIWDAYNGTTTTKFLGGLPLGWHNSGYWSATPGDSSYVSIDFNSGSVSKRGSDFNLGYVALQLVADYSNTAPTGSITITGTTTQGQTLTATNTLADLDGMGTVAYQWRANGTNISGATASTFTLTQAQVGKAITVIASYTDLLGTPETVTSAATGIVGAPGAASQLQGIVYQWKTLALLSDTEVDLIEPGSNSLIDKTDATGLYSFSSLPDGTYELTASKSLTSAETGNAISSADALAALKIAVGINPNSDPDGAGPLTARALSPYQLIAADANGDTRVTSADALAILKMAVNFTGAVSREWLFVNESEDFWNQSTNTPLINKNSVLWDRGDKEVMIDADTTLNLVAVLKGDVNGSWAAPANSTMVAASHFTPLIDQGLGTRDQWVL